MAKISASAKRTLTEERRKQILDAATSVFSEKGYDRATIADVARAAGVAEGSIYNYFKNKTDLLISIPRQIIQTPVEAMMGQMRLAGAAPIPPERMLPIIAKNMMTVFRQNGHIFRILFSALPTLSPSVREEYLNRVIFYIWDILEAYFRELIEKGLLRPDLNPAILTRSFVGMFIPFVLLNQLVPLKGFDAAQVLDQNVKIFLRGVLADEAAPRLTAPKQRQAKKIVVE
jgi:AcrR family transcriptional regulator